jgi:hypothetical protein
MISCNWSNYRKDYLQEVITSIIEPYPEYANTISTDPPQTASMVPIEIGSNNAFVESNSDLLKKFCDKSAINMLKHDNYSPNQQVV